MDAKRTAEPMKILLVEDNRADVRLIREALSEAENFPFQIVHVDRLVQALQRLRVEQFDVVLLDLSLPDSRGLSTLIYAREQAPGIPLVVLTGTDDEALALSAVREGAQDYLVKGQVSGASLVRVLRYSVERHRKSPEGAPAPTLSRAKAGRVIAFMGVKGGCGATAVALNVAGALARQNRSAIALELRPCYGSFSFQLNHVPSDNLSTLAGMGPGGIHIEELLGRLYNFPFGLRVMFGPQKAEEYKEMQVDEAEALIAGVCDMADYCVFDLPCQPSPVSQAVIRKAHFTCLVVERDAVGVHAGKALLDVLNTWGISQRMTGIVIVNRAALFSPIPISQISGQLSSPIVGVIPPAAEALIRAQSSGSPIVLSEPESTISVALADLATRVSADTVAAVQL